MSIAMPAIAETPPTETAPVSAAQLAARIPVPVQLPIRSYNRGADPHCSRRATTCGPPAERRTGGNTSAVSVKRPRARCSWAPASTTRCRSTTGDGLPASSSTSSRSRTPTTSCGSGTRARDGEARRRLVRHPLAGRVRTGLAALALTFEQLVPNSASQSPYNASWSSNWCPRWNGRVVTWTLRPEARPSRARRSSGSSTTRSRTRRSASRRPTATRRRGCTSRAAGCKATRPMSSSLPGSRSRVPGAGR